MSRDGPLTENSSLERLRREVSNLEPNPKASSTAGRSNTDKSKADKAKADKSKAGKA